ncbi:MAG: SDR family NAD(P)-dependent oxidoreductase [Marinosulfonomonas sp.]
MDFTGQTAVVTGGAQGIGLACATRMAQDGARIVVWDMDLDLAQDAAAKLGGDAVAVKVDVSDWDSVQAARDATLDATGQIDVAVNSAGISGGINTLEEYPVEEFARIMNINVLGTFHVNKAVVPTMRAKSYGRIVNIASIAGKEGNPGAAAYSASKAAVIGLTKSLGKELAGVDIGVNCITPAAARTRIFDQISQEHIDFMLSKIPRGRFLEVAEAAEMIAWVASRENSFTTGAVFDLSGGRATY